MKKLVTFTLMLGLMLSANFTYAQAPANDDCANAIALTIAADEASCAAVTGNTTGGTPSAAGYVCSGSWFGDDIWFSFTTGMTVPADGYTIKLTPGTTSTFGMALYTGCGTSEIPFHCFSDASGTITEAVAKGMTANTTYYVRVWSGGGATTNSGTFDICVFNRTDNANVIWEDDFANGISNWTVVGTPAVAVWEWMPIATAGRGSFADSSLVSNSWTSVNGAVIFDSDYYDNSGVAAAPQAGELISPIIDCSNAAAVGLEFSQRFRQFQSTTTVSYSIDGGTTYTDIVINGATAVNAAITRAEERQVLFLNGAGGEANVVIKFTFAADYYYWILDDIRLTSLPAVSDLAISDHIYPAQNYGVPTTQADANGLEGFSILASNIGSTDITGVMAYATVSQGTTVLFADSVSMGTLDSGIDSVATFPNNYSTSGLAVGTYTIGYALGSDSTDFNPADNVVTRTFAITDSTFTNDAGATSASRPGGGGDYLLGNIYEMAPNTGNNVWQVTTAYFTAAKNAADGPLDGSQVSVYLVEVADTVADDYANFDVNTALFQNTALTVVGLGSYTFATGTNSFDDFFVAMTDFNTGAVGVDLKAGTRYFLLVEYAGASNVIFGGLENVDGGPSGMLYSTQWFTGGFNDAAPVARMDIGLKAIIDNTTEELSNASLNVFPNPASDVINLDIEFDEATDATVFITDMSGRLVKSQVLGNITKERATINVSDLAAGTYMVRLSTNEGFKVQRIVIAK